MELYGTEAKLANRRWRGRGKENRPRPSIMKRNVALHSPYKLSTDDIWFENND